MHKKDTIIRIPFSLGAAARRIEVTSTIPISKQKKFIMKGSCIDNIETFAKGKAIREIRSLIEEFPLAGGTFTKVADWRKVKGTGIVTDGEKD